ncbi:MAG: hypothetical protein HZB92_03840 [Euryarchaeota archaeon]|nr:hypothetical protein [Euryarchaeota archaeon]
MPELSVSLNKIWIHRTEYLKVVEVREGSRQKFYSYTYTVKSRMGWLPCVRWDNYEQQPHVDKYDENGALLEQRPCREKELAEVVKLVKIFRRNLSAMDISQL